MQTMIIEDKEDKLEMEGKDAAGICNIYQGEVLQNHLLENKSNDLPVHVRVTWVIRNAV